jgi:ferredoxin
MAIKRVWIEPGCITCHSSVGLCPEVFEVPEEGKSARVKPTADLLRYESAIRLAVENCPVQVIKLDEG